VARERARVGVEKGPTISRPRLTARRSAVAPQRPVKAMMASSAKENAARCWRTRGGSVVRPAFLIGFRFGRTARSASPHHSQGRELVDVRDGFRKAGRAAARPVPT